MTTYVVPIHATAFPTSVHEFDFGKLQWSQLTEDVPLSEFNKENAVLDKDGKGRVNNPKQFR